MRRCDMDFYQKIDEKGFIHIPKIIREHSMFKVNNLYLFEQIGTFKFIVKKSDEKNVSSTTSKMYSTKLQIPSQFMHQLGALPGDTAYLLFGEDSTLIEITPGKNPVSHLF